MTPLTSERAVALFLRLSGALSIVLFAVVLLTPKSVSFIAANPVHNACLDVLFTFITNLGDGIFAIMLIAFFFLRRQAALAWQLVLGFLVSGAAAQILKAWFHAPRPKAFFAPGIYTHFIDGVTCAGLNSFPSGHATTAFMTAAILVVHARRRIQVVAYFLLATLVMYSRIYLGQHFIEDTLAGLCTGIVTALLIGHGSRRWSVHRAGRPRKQNEPLALEL